MLNVPENRQAQILPEFRYFYPHIVPLRSALFPGTVVFGCHLVQGSCLAENYRRAKGGSPLFVNELATRIEPLDPGYHDCRVCIIARARQKI